MMLTSSMVYFAGIADSVRVFFAFLVVVNMVAAVVFFILSVDISDDIPKKTTIKGITTAAVFAMLFAFLAAITPSTKTVAAMYVLPAVASSEAVQKLPAEAAGLALDWVKERREELKK